MQKLCDEKIKSLIIISALPTDPTIRSKDRLREGVVDYATWNASNLTPKGNSDKKGLSVKSSVGGICLRAVGGMVRVQDPFISSLLHYSLLLEIPTLALYTRGYKYKPNYNEKMDDGSEDVALTLSKALKQVLEENSVIADGSAISTDKSTLRTLRGELSKGSVVREGSQEVVDNRAALYL